jgi:PDZ domain
MRSRICKAQAVVVIMALALMSLPLQAAEKDYRGWLGIGLRSLKQKHVRRIYQGQIGAVVENVFAGSPAEEAGLLAGDLITKIDGKQVKAYDHLVHIVSAHIVDDVILLTVYRSGETFNLSVKLDYAPEDLVDRYSKAVGSTKLGFDVLGLDRATARRLDVDYFDGMLVQSVLPEGPAGKAGLQANDLIRAINNKNVRFVEDFNAAIEKMSVGSDFSILIERNGTRYTLYGTVPGRDEPENESEVHQEDLITDDDLLTRLDDEQSGTTTAGAPAVASFEKVTPDYSTSSGGLLGGPGTPSAQTASGAPPATGQSPVREKIVTVAAQIFAKRFAVAEGRSTRFHLLAGAKSPGAQTSLLVTELKAADFAKKLKTAGVIDGTELRLRIILPAGKKVALQQLVSGLEDATLIAIDPQREDTSDLVSLAAFYRNGLCLLTVRDLSLLNYAAKPGRIAPGSGLPDDGTEVRLEFIILPQLENTDQ